MSGDPDEYGIGDGFGSGRLMGGWQVRASACGLPDPAGVQAEGCAPLQLPRAPVNFPRPTWPAAARRAMSGNDGDPPHAAGYAAGAPATSLRKEASDMRERTHRSTGLLGLNDLDDWL